MANSKDVVETRSPLELAGTTKVLISKGFRVFGSVRKPADADRFKKEFGDGFVPLMMDITDEKALHQAAQIPPPVGHERRGFDRDLLEAGGVKVLLAGAIYFSVG